MIQYFRNLMKYFFLIVVMAAITIGAIYAAVIRDYRPSYESTTALLVSPTLDERQYEAYVVLQEAQIAERLLHDIPELVFSTQVREAVNAKMPDGIHYDGVSFRKSLKTEIAINTRVVKVAVRHVDPKIARLVAETIALTVDQLVNNIIGHDFIHVINEAGHGHRVGLSVEHLWAISALGGILLGMALILMLTISEKYTASPINITFPRLPGMQLFRRRSKKIADFDGRCIITGEPLTVRCLNCSQMLSDQEARKAEALAKKEAAEKLVEDIAMAN